MTKILKILLYSVRPECRTKCGVSKDENLCSWIRYVLFHKTLTTNGILKINYLSFVKCLLTFLLIIPFSIFSKEAEEEKISPIKVGNFSLPSSQQPGPFIGFGQNVVEKNDLIVYSYFDVLKGKKRKFSEVAPSFVYGITDKSSIFVEQSVALKFQDDGECSKGIEDLLIQAEGVVFDKSSKTSSDVVTIVGNVTVALGSIIKPIPTGFGSSSFFIGFTASHTDPKWYYFTSVGAIVTTDHLTSKYGSQFLYQFGLSRNICYKTDKYIFNWMVELDGIIRKRNKILGVVDCDSGGHWLFLGPSIYFSTKHLVFQAGISWPIFQNLNGNRFKDKYFAAIDIGWKF